MNRIDTSKRQRVWLKLFMGGAALLAVAHPAQAGWLDTLFGKPAVQTEVAQAGPGQRLWRIREFTTVALVPREAGAAETPPIAPMPALSPEALRQQLALVQIVGRGAPEPLFAADELAELVTPLAQALGRAGSVDDVLLLSSSRRDGGVLASPSAVTARLFVQGDTLQLIVHDARFDFYDNFRGTQVAPRFTFGSRASAGSAQIRSAGASNRRADWLAVALTTFARDAVAPAATPMPPLAATGPAPAVQPARKPLDAASADDIERRLETLKRLREKGLISEDEYLHKRKEILQLL